MSDLEREFEYYLAHQHELVGKYDGKVLIIRGQQVVDVFDTIKEAYIESKKKYETGTFLIQRCSPGDKDYSATFHSRVAIPLK